MKTLQNSWGISSWEEFFFFNFYNPTESFTNITSLANISCQQIPKQPELMCYMCNYANKKNRSCCTNTNRVTARYNCSSVTSLIITTMNGRRFNITRIFVCKCQYLSVTFAKIIIGIKMVENHKTRKNQQTFYKCNMCNNTIKVTLYCITPKWDKEHN